MKRKHKLNLQEVYERLLGIYGHQAWWPARSETEFLAGVILTQNTSWTSVEKAILNLRRAKALSFEKLLRMPEAELASLIRPAGYFNLKTARLKSLLRFIKKEYGSIRAMYREEGALLRQKLLDVHGVGKETADSILLYGAKKPFFVIDAYTKRILSRHGIMNADESYDAYQNLFHVNLPRDPELFNDFHAQIVRLCKEHCRPKPLCAGCPLEGWSGLRKG